MRLLLLLLLFLLPLTTLAGDWDDFVEWTLQQYEGDGDDDSDNLLDAQLERLEALHRNPIELNSCTAAQLESIPFLSPEQVDDILYYVARVQGMRSLAELVYIPSLDIDTRRWLPLFVHVTAPQPTDGRLAQKSLQHELLTRLDLPLYRRQGYTTGNAERRYQGSRLAHSLKYSCRIGNRLSAAFAADKDQGEPLGHPFNTAYDFMGAHIAIADISLSAGATLRTAVIGDYHLGFGEGLLLNQHYSIGKSFSNATGIKGKSSTAEQDFMRGAAATLTFCRRFSVTPFVSYTLLDATTDSEGRASSLSQLTTHRNQNEMDKRHNTSETLCGLHSEWRDSLWWVGATAFSSHFHLPFAHSEAAYRRFYPEGQDFWGASLDYGLRIRRFTLRGETATDGHGTATLNRLHYRHNARLQAQLAARLYSRRYHSFHSRALAEWGVQNEQGLYLAVNGEATRRLQLTLNLDLFRSPHPRYQISHPTQGQQLRLRADYTPNRRHALWASASLKRREQYDIFHLAQRYQLGWKCSLSALTLRTIAQLSHYSDRQGRRSLGHALQARATWQPTLARHTSQTPLRLDISAAWFNTHDYYSRLYLSEPSLIAAPTYAMLYGRGLRLAATARLQLARQVTLALRYAFTRRLDQSTIGSDLQAINAPWQNDLSLQLRIRLKHNKS